MKEGDFEQYIEHQNKVLRQIGEELAAKMPKFYGKVTMTIQGGKLMLSGLDYDQDGIEVHRTVK